jgi:serine protease inhibitor
MPARTGWRIDAGDSMLGEATRGVLSGKQVVVRADRPFVLLIHGARTGAILFLGRLVEPVSETG